MKEKQEKTEHKKEEKKEGKKEFIKKEQEEPEILVRIMSADIAGNKNVLVGLTKLKGISWSISNFICNALKIEKSKKIGELSKEEIEKILKFIGEGKFPRFLLNRRKDIETGEDKHLVGVDLDLQKEFDIKAMKKMKTYKGIRHSAGQPVRGQRTRSHFRTKGKKKAVGVKKKAK